MNNCFETTGKPRALIYLKLILTAVFWGGTFVAGRVVSREAAPFSAAFLRFIVASVFLLGFQLKSLRRKSTLREPAPVGPSCDAERPRYTDAKTLSLLLLLGLTGVFAYNVFFFSGLKTVTASRASLIIAANPAFIALFSRLLFKEKLGFMRAAGIFISIAGATAVICKGSLSVVLHGRLGVGELYILGCVASWVSYSLLGKKALRNVPPLAAVTGACVMGTMCLIAPALHEGILSQIATYSISVWLGIFYLGFFGTALGFIWYYEGILAIGASRAGIFISIVPVSSVILAFFLLNESIDASVLLGTGLVITGVYITNRESRN